MTKASVAELAKLPGVWRGGELEHAAQPVIATGHAALDRELPGGGWPTGTLTEVLHDGVGIGEISLLAPALARSTAAGRSIAWIDPPHLPYAPALARTGIDLSRCLVVKPKDREDALWACEQALRSGACGAVLSWLGHAEEQYACLRRLSMAAEAGRAMAVLFRSTSAERSSTPAHLRVVLSRNGELLEIRIPKRRGPPLISPLRLRLGTRARAPIVREPRSDCAPALVFSRAPAPIRNAAA